VAFPAHNREAFNIMFADGVASQGDAVLNPNFMDSRISWYSAHYLFPKSRRLPLTPTLSSATYHC
jgi:hypothetical protein